MKNFVLFIFLCSLFSMKSQVVQSSCQRSDSIYDSWDREAARLAIRRVYKYALPYKDSIKPEPNLRARYRRALLAVYNATTLPVTDTIFNQLSIFSKPVPEINSMRVEANPTLLWMTQLYNSQAPVSSAVINNLMIKYNMRYVYAQSSPNDVVVFITDTCLNMSLLIPQFLSQNAFTATNVANYNDTRDINDSLNTNFVQINYAFGWGSCGDGCDYRRTYSFKVYADCSVEYLGASGPPLYFGIASYKNSSANKYKVQNPGSGTLRFLEPIPACTITIRGMDGSVVCSFQSTDNVLQYPLHDISAGVYNLEIKDAYGTTHQRLLITD